MSILIRKLIVNPVRGDCRTVVVIPAINGDISFNGNEVVEYENVNLIIEDDILTCSIRKLSQLKSGQISATTFLNICKEQIISTGEVNNIVSEYYFLGELKELTLSFRYRTLQKGRSKFAITSIIEV